MRIYDFLRRTHSRCKCDTMSTNLFNYNIYNDTTDQIYNSCPHCTDTTGGYTKEENEERWQRAQEREDLQIMVLGRLVQYIRNKVIVPHTSQNIINKTMRRRMMNGRQ